MVTEQAQATEEHNKEIARRIFEELYNEKKYEIAQELVAADCIYHNTLQSEPLIGPEGVIEFMKIVHVGWPDSYFTMDDIIADGDRVATRQTFHGTNTGLLHGKHAPTGKTATVTEVVIAHFNEEGKVQEAWQVLNALNILQQIGVLPPEETMQAMARIPKPVKAMLRGIVRVQQRFDRGH